MQKPLINDKYQLEKTPGKGGWTYVIIPRIHSKEELSFSKAKFKGFIDAVEIKYCRLMSVGKDRLFLPVKAAIRKQLRKKAGDWVKVVLFLDDTPVEIPAEFLLCLEEDQTAYDFFLRCTGGQQQAFINWIYAAKTETTKINRMAKALNKLVNGEKYV